MKTILLLSAVSLISACTTSDKMSRIERGMTRQQVVAILGRPDAVHTSGPYEQLEYTNRLIPWTGNRTDFNVSLKDGRVVEYGHGEVRNTGPQTVYMQSNAANQPEQPIIYPYQPQPQTQNINVRVQTPPSGPPSWSNPYGN
jgi:hypothetical protein